MNIIARGLAFLQWLVSLSQRSAWDWRRCPQCGSTVTCKWGRYRAPARGFWRGGSGSGCSAIAARRAARPIRSSRRCWCGAVGMPGKCIAVRLIIGSTWAPSLRRTAEVLRSWLGHQERWLLWRPLDAEPASAAIWRPARCIAGWMGRARRPKRAWTGNSAALAQTQAVGTDGLWAKLKGQAQRVVLLVVDSVSGLVYPPVVAQGEESAGPWQRLFERASRPGWIWRRCGA